MTGHASLSPPARPGLLLNQPFAWKMPFSRLDSSLLFENQSSNQTPHATLAAENLIAAYGVWTKDATFAG